MFCIAFFKLLTCMALPQVINKEELCREENKMFLVEKEIEIMSQLDHPNIVKLYEVYVNDEEVEKSASATMLLSPFTNMLKTSILSFYTHLPRKYLGRKRCRLEITLCIIINTKSLTKC